MFHSLGLVHWETTYVCNTLDSYKSMNLVLYQIQFQQQEQPLSSVSIKLWDAVDMYVVPMPPLHHRTPTELESQYM